MDPSPMQKVPSPPQEALERRPVHVQLDQSSTTWSTFPDAMLVPDSCRSYNLSVDGDENP